MAYRFPSAEWTAAYKDAVNANEDYRRAGKEWIHGAVAMVVKADPAVGLETDTGMVLDVHGGECRNTTFVESLEEAQVAPFVILAPYARWRELIEGQHDPIKAMMQGRLRLTQGHLPTIIRYVESSKQLVVSASRVPTEFVG